MTVSPIRDAGGKVVGASKIARDITERKQAEATRQLLLNELNHRVKNTLASVQAIVQQTLRHAHDPIEFSISFGGRVQSLARVNSLLSDTSWQGADLRDLIRDQVQSGAMDETRVRIWGPSVRLDPQMALHLALMLHELGTNSCKYGALSVASGCVTVTWTTDDALHIEWKERGGPLVVTPSRSGFGLTLINQSAKGQGGDARMICEAAGITWNITLPLRDSSAFNIVSRPVSSASEAAAAGDKSRTSLVGRRFLVVEDEPLIGLDIVDGLEEADAQVEGPVGTVKAAIEIIGRTPLDGALLDANLHGNPVDEIASALTRRNVPFVFVTGHGPNSLPQAFRGIASLGKPFSRQQLLDTAARLVATRSDFVPLRR
jgi:two-component sensor histidine kinase